MDYLLSSDVWLAFLTLTVLEIVLGIDNIIFISILTDRLPESQRARGRFLGLSLAMAMRILLLLSITWVMHLRRELFVVLGEGISGRDLILILGGAFLIAKSVVEVHKKLEEAKAEHDTAHDGTPPIPSKPASFAWTMVTIAVIDIVFSLDSVITAIGMVDQVWVMVIAMVIAMLVMLYFAGPISRFVEKHPTIKILALSFLILIGVMLVAEGLGQHIDKGYIYAAMAFAMVVEMINMQIRRPKRKKEPPVEPEKTGE